MRRAVCVWLSWLPLVVAGFGALGCSKTAGPPPPGLMIIVGTDMRVSEFDSLRVEVSQEQGTGSNQWQKWLDEIKRVPNEATLPTTVFVQSGSAPDQDALVQVTALLLGQPVVLREAQVQIPIDRVAELRLVLAEACKGQVRMVGAEGEPAAACPMVGQSCQPDTGRCGDTVIANSAALPTYSPGDESLDAAASLSEAGPLTDVRSDDAGDRIAMMTETGASDATALCTDVCTPDTIRCASGAVQICQMQANGCPLWITTATCSKNKTCAVAGADAGAAPSCTCNSSVCMQEGTTCQDRQTLVHCMPDADGCIVGMPSMCPSGQSCGGEAPSASCGAVCQNSCTAGQTSCVSGQLATCTKGSDGCYSYGAPVTCGVHQTCTGVAGAAACTCVLDSVCSASGDTCASSKMLSTCGKDGHGCLYVVASGLCTNGACSAGACCTNTCTAGQTRCVNGQLGTCALQSNGCLDYGTPAACGRQQSCTGPPGNAACTCNTSVCTGVGKGCQDQQTLVGCAQDTDGCLVASPSACPPGQSCGGLLPGASCSTTCQDSCGPGQTSCINGQLATCTKASNGCYSYGTPVVCGAHQTCTGMTGTAACTCNAAPVCTTAGNSCAGSNTLASCAKDVQGCFYAASSSACGAHQSCAGSAGSATCMCNTDTVCGAVGSTCADATTLATCAKDSQSCVYESATSACGTHQSCTGAAGAAACTCNADPVCSAAGTTCANSTTLATCTKDSQNCVYASATSACSGGRTCQSGNCACPSGDSVCSGQCVDEQTDPNNCGGCGIACSGMCSLGRCRLTLVSGQINSQGIAVDATSVYWTDSNGNAGAVMKVPLGGGTPITLASAQRQPQGIAVDATSVYWANTDGGGTTGTVMKVPLGGGTAATLASGYVGPVIAVDATSVYWAGSALMKVPLGGGTPTTLAATGGFDIRGIAVDATSVYWTEYGNGAVMKVPLAGGTPTMLASGRSGPVGIAVDSTSAYWTEYNAGNAAGLVMKVPLAGGTPTTLASAQYDPRYIAVDATSVYWTTYFGSSVLKVPLGGGTPITLASGGSVFLYMAIDGTSIYVPNGDGTVSKVTPK